MSEANRSWPAYPAIDDPALPRWHFGPPAQWMNDPNGTIFHDGWYHVFYQHNPGGEEWGDLHWGHARSRDLVYWEHLPLALFPQHAAGEKHCYSGCAALDASGTPHILYTSVKHSGAEAATQVIASPTDATLTTWTQDVAHPVLDLSTYGGPAFESDWRDPYVFRTAGRTFLVLGATLADEAVVALYENSVAEQPGVGRALRPTLRESPSGINPDPHSNPHRCEQPNSAAGDLRLWVYRGIVHRAPKSETKFFECPNFFPLGNKWMLLTSPCREAEWCSGAFDLATCTFRIEQRGRVDEGRNFYATQTLVDPAGHTVVLGWVQGFPKGRGWNGRLAAPRRVWLDAAGHLCAEPIMDFWKLRLYGEHEKTYLVQELGATPATLDLPGDHSHEGNLVVERAPSASVRLEVAGVTVTVGPDGVRFNDRPPVPLAPASTHGIRWFFDRSMIEFFVGERAVFTQVLPFPQKPVARLSATGGFAKLWTARAWALKPAPATRGF